MGCAPSNVDGAEPRRRGWARARASTSALLTPRRRRRQKQHQQQQQGHGQEAESSGGRRRGCKVAPEPKDLEEGTAALPPMRGSPSFRHYCQKKTAAVDRILADADDSDASVRAGATVGQVSTGSETTATKAPESSQVSQPKEGARWLRFSGLSVVSAAWYNLFSRHSSKPSPPPPAASAASSHV